RLLRRPFRGTGQAPGRGGAALRAAVGADGARAQGGGVLRRGARVRAGRAGHLDDRRPAQERRAGGGGATVPQRDRRRGLREGERGGAAALRDDVELLTPVSPYGRTAVLPYTAHTAHTAIRPIRLYDLPN